MGGGRGGRGEGVKAEAEATKETRIATEASMVFADTLDPRFSRQSVGLLQEKCPDRTIIQIPDRGGTLLDFGTVS
jgi:hypothetical protein